MTPAPTVAQPLSAGDVLRAAADLLEKPGAWTQGNLGRDAHGRPVLDAARIGEAVCFCMAGAVWRASGINFDLTMKVFDDLRSQTGRHGIGSWNDDDARTQAEVVSALRAAAESAAS